MFAGCTALTGIPKLHFIFCKTKGCRSMFNGCSSLIAISDIDVLYNSGNSCFEEMFCNCTSLVRADIVCRTSASGSDVYKGMFRGCTSLVTPPTIVGTTLSNNYRFSQMFMNCTALERTPDLLPTTLSHTCYYQMFNGCTSLKYVKCLAIDISATSCTSNWLKDVSPTGTFVKAASMNDWPTGDSGIPEGWTIIEATE